MSEALYDEKIAPVLAELGALCREHKLPFLAIVEYAPGDFGQTAVTTPEQSLPMLNLPMPKGRGFVRGAPARR